MYKIRKNPKNKKTKIKKKKMPRIYCVVYGIENYIAHVILTYRSILFITKIFKLDTMYLYYIYIDKFVYFNLSFMTRIDNFGVSIHFASSKGHKIKITEKKRKEHFCCILNVMETEVKEYFRQNRMNE